MRPANPFQKLAVAELFETLLPDFVLAFAFFTSVVYAVLAKRFDSQRPAIGMSASLGLALSVGLVWWEQSEGLSIRNLGPIAVVFSILLLFLVMYQAVRQVGGSWAGACISLGVAMLVATLLVPLPIEPEIINTITTVALVIGILLFLSKNHSRYAKQDSVPPHRADIRHDMTDLYRGQWVSDRLTDGLHKLRKQARALTERPEQTAQVLTQLKRMLPAEGWLTDRMARLRQKAHVIRNGHVAKLEETKYVLSKLPSSVKKKAAAELAIRYRQLSGIDTRLERLDKAVAETELRIRNLTAQAQRYTERGEQKRLYDTLKEAEKLQHHNSRLIRIIERTEGNLSAIAKKVAKEVRQIGKS